MAVFLGGLCKDSTWRVQFMESLDKNNISYYNPQVEAGVWNDEHAAAEHRGQLSATVLVFVTEYDYDLAGPITKIEIDTFKELVPHRVLVGSEFEFDCLIDETIKLVKILDGCVGDDISSDELTRMKHEFAEGRRVRGRECDVNRTESFEESTFDDDFVKFLVNAGFYYFDGWLRCHGCGLMIRADKVDSDSCEDIELMHMANALNCKFLNLSI